MAEAGLNPAPGLPEGVGRSMEAPGSLLCPLRSHRLVRRAKALGPRLS